MDHLKHIQTKKLVNIDNDFDGSESTVKGILEANNIKYFEKIKITPLIQGHRSGRLKFTCNFIGKSYRDMPNIF